MWLSSFLVTAVLILLGWVWIRPRRTRSSYPLTDKATRALLHEAPSCEAANEPQSLARFSQMLSSFPSTNDIDECAEQVRALVRSGLLEYRAHESDPEQILKVSGYVSTDHAALMTRFTVQYNLYAGSVVALGTDEQRAELYETQASGELGCFAFTELGAGVMTGVRVDTVAEYDRERDLFVITSASIEARKNWISQGSVAERAVVLARLRVDGTDLGPHLFWVRLRQSGHGLQRGVSISLVPEKNSMLGLDNAIIDFQGFEAPRSALLSRFASLDRDGKYQASLPRGCRRILDLVLTRLLTGRLCLSEFALAHALELLRHNWAYCERRRLFRGEQTMSQVLSGFFVDRARCLAVLLV